MRKVLFAVTILMFLVLGSSGFAEDRRASAGGTWSWVSDETWGWNPYPVAGDKGYIVVGSGNGTHVVIDGTSEECYEVHVASWSSDPNLCSLSLVNGASLTVGHIVYVGLANGGTADTDVGELNVDAGCTLTILDDPNADWPEGHLQEYLYIAVIDPTLIG